MNRFSTVSITATVAMLLFAGPAFAKGNKKMRCFSDGANATCVINRDSTTLTVYPTGYAGVYLDKKPRAQRGLGSLRFSFTSYGNVSGGSPRFSIPINISGGTTIDGYAFLDVSNCGGAANTFARVDTANPQCKVFFNAEDYENWAEFSATFPDARIAASAIPFIIADQPGSYTITNIDLR